MNTKSRVDYFAKKIIENSESLNSYYNCEFYMFCSMSMLIAENLNCLLLGLTQASVFTTNHLLERVLKQALIDYHMNDVKIGHPDYDTLQKEAYELYDGKKLYYTAKLAREKGIINTMEESMIHTLRNKLRNPFSHANMTKIVPSQVLETPFQGFMFSIDETQKAISENRSAPYEKIEISNLIFAQEIQQSLAEATALTYFDKVFTLMKNIDNRYISKYEVDFPFHE